MSIKSLKEMPLLASIIWQNLLPHFAVIQKASSRKWLSKYLPKEAGVNGLHIGCGNGEDTFLIASLLDKKHNLYGIEENKTLVEHAKRTKVEGNWENVHFINSSPFTWKSAQPCDFVYCRIWIADLLEQEHFFSNTRKNLKENGLLILEIIQFSGFSAYPYNPAFSRAAELIAKAEQSYTNTSGIAEKGRNLLQNQGFQVLEVNYSSPVFIGKKNKNILSQILASFKQKLLQLKLVKEEELNPLLHELQRYEAREDTLISRPGVNQILASK